MKWIFPVEIHCHTILSECVAIKGFLTHIFCRKVEGNYYYIPIFAMNLFIILYTSRDILINV